MRYLVAAFALLCSVAFPIDAQDRGEFGELVQVELVLVDVVAVDSSGDPVLDLDRDDFRLLRDGQPVTISQFTPPAAAPRGEVLDPEEVLGARVTTPRHLVIFVDNLHLLPGSRLRVFDELSKIVDDHLSPDDQVMVVAYAGSTQVVLPMTKNRRKLKAALRDQMQTGAVSLMATNDSQRALESIATAREHYAQGSREGGAACRDVGHLADAHARESYGRVVGTIDELERFVKTLAAFEGPKMLLHVSDGIPLIPGAEAYRFASELCDGTGANKGIANAIDGTTSTGLRLQYWDPTKTEATLRELDTSGNWTRLADHANTYQVSFYTYQAHQTVNRGASVDATRTSMEVEMLERRNREDPLLLLAEQTGGVATLNANDVAPALDTIGDDARFGYQLAFEPEVAGDGRSHQVEVHVDRPGVSLRYRKSYRSKNFDERIADRVLSVLMHGQQANPLDVRVKLGLPEVLDGQPNDVKVHVRVPFDQLVLLPQESGANGLFTVFVAVKSGHGRIAGVGQKTLPIVVPTDGSEATAFTYQVDVPVWGRGGEIAIGVQDEIGREVSYLLQPVELTSDS